MSIPGRTLLAQFLRSPLQRFIELESASGLLLLAAALIAVAWANSPWSASYVSLWELAPPPSFGALPHVDLRFLINDGLMTVFFLVVGLELRRELHGGELRTLSMAALPVFAAAGGVLAPAVLFVTLTNAPSVHDGWAVPTATDIAFAIGILALLGSRVPHGLRVLLLTIAVLDDIAAIAVIAIFYSAGLDPAGLCIALGGILAMWLLRARGVTRPLLYVVAAVTSWTGLLAAGIHPTVAGLALGLLTPAAPQHGAAQSPAEQLESRLHPWVAFGVMPLFALANAGVDVGAIDWSSSATRELGIAIVLGLVVGKPFGIVVAVFLAVRARLCRLPDGVTWGMLVVIGCLAGIGFTMAIFIAGLAFDDAQLLGAAKAAILLASLIAGVTGFALGLVLLKRPRSASPHAA